MWKYRKRPVTAMIARASTFRRLRGKQKVQESEDWVDTEEDEELRGMNGAFSEMSLSLRELEA